AHGNLRVEERLQGRYDAPASSRRVAAHIGTPGATHERYFASRETPVKSRRIARSRFGAASNNEQALRDRPTPRQGTFVEAGSFKESESRGVACSSAPVCPTISTTLPRLCPCST